MSISVNSKRTPPPPHRGTLNLPFRIIGPLLAAFASALLLTACPPPGGTPTGNTGGTTPTKTTYTATITGTVQDASRPGVGLPRATVSASTTPAATTTTDANGAFRLQVTHSGSLSLTLTAEKACYETASPKTITIANNTPYNAKAIELTPVPEPQGSERFSLTPPGGPPYTLTIAECVRTIAAGEFTPTPVLVTDPSDATRTITAATRLAGLLGSSGQDEKVTAIILPESLINIGERAFSSHRKVNGELIIPASVERIGKQSFASLGSFYTEAASRKGSVKFAPNSKLREIGDYAFEDSIIDTVSELPATLKTIGKGAFLSNNLGIRSTNFIIPENVERIGNAAFAARGTASTRVSGKLTIASPKLTRTPGDTTLPRTGELGSRLFHVPDLGTALVNPFTTIALHEAVFDSYTQADLNAIFGTGGQYVDILNETRVLTK